MVPVGCARLKVAIWGQARRSCEIRGGGRFWRSAKSWRCDLARKTREQDNGLDHPAEVHGIPVLTWRLLQQVFTAETIMTPARELFKAEHDTDLPSRWVEARRNHFDLLPVTEGGRIIGILHEGATEPKSLTDRWLVSRDTGMADLLTLFAESGQPGFLVFHRQDVVGLVTPADLNKLPARVYVYNLIGEMELALASRVRARFSDRADELLQTLGEKRREELWLQLDELVQGNVNVDLVELLHLSDLINAVAKDRLLRTELEFPSRRAAETALGGLNALRNQTMHLVRPLLKQLPEDLATLQERISRATELLERMSMI